MAGTRCIALAWMTLATVASVPAADFHVAPDGSPQGTGAAERPWDLATALAAEDKVQPGDTVWLHGATYRGGFVSKLKGRPGAPVVVRSAAGERVTIDTHPRDERDNGLLLLGGADAIYRDFEVTCSHPLRETKIAGSWPEDIRRGNVDIRGDRIAAVNLVVHDCASGFGFWAEGEGGEISGCVIYNNGWRGPDRGHGHAVYAQNARGTKRIADNIVFHQFAYGIHVYGSEKASLKGFEIDGNIAFENGCLARKGDNAPGIMVGGASPAARIAVRDNVVVGGGIRLGYPWGVTSEDVVCTGNYSEGLVVRDFRHASISKNTLVASSTVASLEGAADLLLGGLKWNDNEYYVTDGRWGECSVVENGKSRGLSFAEWRKFTGLDTDSRFTQGAPHCACASSCGPTSMSRAERTSPSSIQEEPPKWRWTCRACSIAAANFESSAPRTSSARRSSSAITRAGRCAFPCSPSHRHHPWECLRRSCLSPSRTLAPLSYSRENHSAASCRRASASIAGASL